MKSPFDMVRGVFSLEKSLGNQMHLWAAIVATIRLVMHWSRELPITDSEGGAEGVAVWLVIAIWGIIGWVTSILRGKMRDKDDDDTSSGPPSVVVTGLLLGLLLMMTSCTQTRLLVKKAFKCSVACIKGCMAEAVIKTAPSLITTERFNASEADE
tara:strand:- start:2529 stop:2993 length:465 start_codon:yes stop_codon:yes gene_type:complete